MKTKKAKHTLIVVIVCVCITVLTTLGVGFYNYYGYVAYKTQFLDEYFVIHDKKTISNQEKIENALKWESAYYIKNPGKITFRDPGVNPYPTKTPIGSEKLDGDVLNVNAYFDGETLHLPNYFDVNFYSQYVDFSNAENAEEKAKINYYFFFSNINYNTIPNFDPDNIHATFVEGIGEESDQLLQEAIDETIDTDVSIGNMSSPYHYSYLAENQKDVLATYTLKDTAQDVHKEDKEDQLYYIYRNSNNKSYDNKTTFGSSTGLTFSIYYMGKDSNNSPVMINILEGTFEPELFDEKAVDITNYLQQQNVLTGYSESYNQPDYNTFVKPKIITSGAITFVVSALISAILGIIWTFEPKQKR